MVLLSLAARAPGGLRPRGFLARHRWTDVNETEIETARKLLLKHVSASDPDQVVVRQAARQQMAPRTSGSAHVRLILQEP